MPSLTLTLLWISACVWVSAVVVSGQVSPCQDLDTTACVLLHKQKPDLCADPSFYTQTCRRFCGKCPLTCYDCATPVNTPSDCITTVTCSTNETCVTKHLKAPDGHHEYMMSCEPQDMCIGLGFGFVGKKSIQSRDVSIECCDTDFCNMPTRTTVTIPKMTTTPTPLQQTTWHSLHGCNKDIVFALDDSSSLGAQNFRYIIDFFKKIISSLDIGVHSNQVSFITFSSHVQIEWYLKSHLDKSSLLQAMDRIRYKAGETRTDIALDTIRYDILDPSVGDRTGVSNVVVVVMDGYSNLPKYTDQAANLLQHVSNDVISIGFGDNFNMTELVSIATDSHHVIDVSTYIDLDAIIPQLLSLMCC